jgi:6,7-dimethyl-8-ribityllumazine synthase
VNRDIDDSSENVLEEWSRRVAGEGTPPLDDEEAGTGEGGGGSPFDAEVLTPSGGESWAASATQVEETETDVAEPAPDEHADEAEEPAEPEEAEAVPYADDAEAAAITVEPSQEHAIGELEIPDGYAVLEGYPDGSRRAVGVVVARFNGGVTSRLLERALEELDSAGVPREAITVMVVPGAFELPIAATALAKTRRFACIVALGCIIRGDTPHFDYVASEAASGLQLAALETGVPVSFGVLTLDRVEQADPRVEKGAEAVRTALEMADVFSHLRAAATR